MFSVAVYTISIFDKKSASIPLSNISGGKCFYDFLHEYLNRHAGTNISLTKNRILRISDIISTDSQDIIAGYVKTGEFGFESEIFNTEKRNIAHKRRINEAELIPFQFLFAIPQDGNKAILILQRFKQYGVRKFFGEHLKQRFSETFNGIKMEIRRVTPATVVDSILSDSQIKTMRFIKYELPTDIADIVSGTGAKPEEATMEISIRAKRNKSFSITEGIRGILTGKKNFSDIVEIANINFDALKLEVEINGTRRTIDIGSPEKFTANIEINVKTGTNGHPQPEPLFDESVSIASDIAKQIGFSIRKGKYKSITNLNEIGRDAA